MGDILDSSNPLEALMLSGTVRGTCLTRKGEVVFEKFPYSASRLVKVCRVFEGLTNEFSEQGRTVDQIAFGYDGGNLLGVTFRDYRLIVMHTMNDEIDFLAAAARAYLKDMASGDRDDHDSISIDTVPISVAKARRSRSPSVEETSKVEVLDAAPVEEESKDMEELDPENMSVEDLVGYFASREKKTKA